VSGFLVKAGLAGLAALWALTLAGCIDSSGPILASSQDVFGPKLKIQIFALRDGRAREPAQAEFRWNGSLYEHAGGGLREVSAFSAHAFEGGDFIIQEVSAKRPRVSEYALLHKLADGVYMVWPIDEDDADEPTRAAFCGKGTPKDPSPCRIETREQLFAFARATAARAKPNGGLAVRLPDGAEKPQRAAKPAVRAPRPPARRPPPRRSPPLRQ
jgi:hypothetical protein